LIKLTTRWSRLHWQVLPV